MQKFLNKNCGYFHLLLDQVVVVTQKIVGQFHAEEKVSNEWSGTA